MTEIKEKNALEKLEEHKEELDDLKPKVIDMDYQMVSTSRNFAFRLFDVVIFIITTVLLLFLSFFVMENTSVYKKNNNRVTEVRRDSHLYKEIDNKLVPIYSYYSIDSSYSEDLMVEEKANLIETDIKYFFNNYFSNEDNLIENIHSKFNKELSYQDLMFDSLKDYENDNNEKLFDEKCERVFPNKYFDKYLNIYCDITKDEVMGFLAYVKNYKSSNNTTLLCIIFTIILTACITYIIFYFIIPLIFKRGKKTLGMLVCQVSLLSLDGFSCPFKRFFIRFIFKFFIIFLLSFVSFLLPIAVSLTIMFLSKSHQSLSEYVTNTYIVYSADKSVYLSLGEMESLNKTPIDELKIKSEYDKI